MSKQIESDLRQHLENNETLLWTGQPGKGIVFIPEEIPLYVLALGFAILWPIAGFIISELIAAYIICLIVGFIFLFIIDSKKRKNTYYGLTEDRIIIKWGFLSKKIKSLNIKTLSDIKYIEKKDESGTILIEPKHPMMLWGNGMKANTQIYSIPNVRKVYNQIIKIQKEK